MLDESPGPIARHRTLTIAGHRDAQFPAGRVGATATPAGAREPIPAAEAACARSHSYTRLPRLLLLVAAAVMLAGCTAAATAPTDPAATEARTAEEPVASGDGLGRDIMYMVLVGELASQLGVWSVSLEHYLDAARETRNVDIAARAVKIAVMAQDDERALEAARLWSEFDPSSVDAAQVLASLQLRAGDVGDAVERLDQIVQTMTDPPESGFQRITELLAAEKDTESAVDAMRQLVLRHDDNAEAHLALARILAQAGEFGEALVVVKRASELAPDHEHIVIFQARARQRINDVDTAIKGLSEFLERVPDSSTVRMTYARLLVDARRYDDALSEFRHLVAHSPDNDEARFALGLLLVQTERLDEAVRNLEEIPKASPRRFAALFYLARIAEAQERVEDAIATYGRVRGGEHRLNAQTRVAILLAETGDLDAARRHLHGVRALNTQERVRILLTEGGLLMRAERYEDAMLVYDRSLEDLPGNTDLLYARGMLAERMDRLDLLERDMREIISREPDNAEALNALGYTLADRTDRYEEAYELIMRAIELRPDDHYIVDSLGWVLYRMGRHEEALEHLQRAMSITPDPEIAAHLGEVLWVLGQKLEAREVWNTALEQSPEDETLLDVIDRYGL